VTNPKKFMPDRWLRTEFQENVHPFLMLPFGHGPRMCIGRRFAEQEISIFLAKIMQQFSVEWHHDMIFC
jgi:cytochrome P450